jgi:hypothetical protein
MAATLDGQVKETGAVFEAIHAAAGRRNWVRFSWLRQEWRAAQ